MSYTHYCLAATTRENGGIKLYRGMYSRSDAAETPELAKLCERPRTTSANGPTVVTRVETRDSRDFPGQRDLVREVIVEVLPD